MMKVAIPVLRVTSSAAAEHFYCAKLGFTKQFAYRPDPDKADPCWLGVVRDRALLRLSSFPGDGVPGGGVQVFVDDVDALYAEFRRSGAPGLQGEPIDQTWGNRELLVKDPDGNRLCFAEEKRPS